jgi:hypothetical protein
MKKLTTLMITSLIFSAEKKLSDCAFHNMVSGQYINFQEKYPVKVTTETAILNAKDPVIVKVNEATFDGEAMTVQVDKVVPTEDPMRYGMIRTSETINMPQNTNAADLFHEQNPFNQMLQQMLEYNAAFGPVVDAILDSPDLPAIMERASEGAQPLFLGHMFKNDYGYADWLSSAPEYAKQVATLNKIGANPTKECCRIYMIINALATGLTVDDAIHNPNSIDLSRKILEHFQMLENDKYNLDVIFNVIYESRVASNFDFYVATYRRHVLGFIQRIFQDDSYINETIAILKNDKELCKSILPLIRASGNIKTRDTIIAIMRGDPELRSMLSFI